MLADDIGLSLAQFACLARTAMHANPDIGGLIKDDVKLNMCIDHSKPGSGEWDHDHSEASLDGSEENSSTGMPSAAAIRSVIKRAEQAIQLKALTAEERAAQFLMLARGVQKLRLHGSWQARGRECTSSELYTTGHFAENTSSRHAWHRISFHDF
jgi:hypothetical protein